ncbi:bifunctional 2-C-methyl-D-erythritol 4-phosphate cytidylyltransferase/2-C-methyl-D-erythritol 2,4-cyclodiphosphate synthase [Granulibacter bethesdensis]|uniref:bifunctional 2-C-methyl-D-erythritol 4-phosphate cytidylyltransferase/2-C-methyl-D-erythritol 2,4-cyclodiphosphate synthase n=1 Tax=Granulibacter bethesdensis TaxID=364410 RepID=UPI0003F1CC8F|nr:bifunctional 2-C-methyl-D-erythritol 4-phosphate cytidylyltransferase/2-C-methyl-D-erythritol 2,4-cyclodiphosphate synthase [Granulibacter bethesdensis]AHJ69193.1 2-C-methyl-D-erythritol 2,4-cyclodiphosphate synthase [Granulibacter bethesdensis]
MRIAAILVAGGSGSRFGSDIPKQFLPVGGKPLIRHGAERLSAKVDLLQPVGCADDIAPLLQGLDHLPIVDGGKERQDSVRAGLEALVPYAPDIVLIHDAARPYFPDHTIDDLIEALRIHDGAIPAVPVADTLKRAAGNIIDSTVPREGLYRAQTPQAFKFSVLLALHRDHPGGATDDAALLDQAGHSVALVPGAEDNIKVTYPADLARVERSMSISMIPRIGTGYDVHAFETGRKLILCGIEVPHHQGLAGHSDADVGIHALCDAIYGALAEGDIGRHFPPTEASWKDADSARFLRHAAERIAARGGFLANADLTLICEKPKITPHAPAMIARLAELLGVSIDKISVKATTSEKLGFTGREEGIAAQAAVIIMIPA